MIPNYIGRFKVAISVPAFTRSELPDCCFMLWTVLFKKSRAMLTTESEFSSSRLHVLSSSRLGQAINDYMWSCPSIYEVLQFLFKRQVLRLALISRLCSQQQLHMDFGSSLLPLFFPCYERRAFLIMYNTIRFAAGHVAIYITSSPVHVFAINWRALSLCSWEDHIQQSIWTVL